MATSTEDRYKELQIAALNLLMAYERQEDENPYRIALWKIIEEDYKDTFHTI